jgi:hypothetical protein
MFIILLKEEERMETEYNLTNEHRAFCKFYNISLGDYELAISNDKAMSRADKMLILIAFAK